MFRFFGKPLEWEGHFVRSLAGAVLPFPILERQGPAALSFSVWNGLRDRGYLSGVA